MSISTNTITNFDTTGRWLTTLSSTSTYINTTMLDDIFQSIDNDLKNNISNLNTSLNNYDSLIQKRNNLKKLFTDTQKHSDSNTVYKNNNTTDNRKSYYEGQQYENLLYWYSSLLWLYYFIGIIIIIIIFVADTTLSMTYRICISILIALYPFIVNLIVKSSLKIYNFISGMLPNNIYNNI